MVRRRALVAVAGLAAGCATDPAASASPVARNASAAKTPGWQMQTPPEPAGTANRAFGAVSCSSSTACLSIATHDDDQHGYGQFAETWAGATMSQLGTVACSGTTACTAVGSSGKGSGAPGLLAERWNGSAWKIQPVPAPSSGRAVLAAVACPRSGRLPRGGQRQGGPVLRGLGRIVMGAPAGPGTGRRI